MNIRQPLSILNKGIISRQGAMVWNLQPEDDRFFAPCGDAACCKSFIRTIYSILDPRIDAAGDIRLPLPNAQVGNKDTAGGG